MFFCTVLQMVRRPHLRNFPWPDAVSLRRTSWMCTMLGY